MNKLVRISKILNVEPFKITALWNNGEIRMNDFTKTFEQWKASENTHLLGLIAWEIFKNVSVTNEPPRTLEWVNYPITFTFKGKTQTTPTDLDPDVFKDTYELDVINIDGGTELLGFCDYNNNTIGINNNIVGTNRELFVIAHEFGHYILHQKLSIGQIEYDTFEDSKYNFRTGKNHLNNPKHWIEWQANFFASSLLLSQRVVLGRLWICQDQLNKSRGKIYLDDQYHDVKDFRALVDRLSYLFNVSKTSIIYKLEEMELINNQSRLKSIGQIISENAGGGELYI